jgi:hypothetical protein
MMFNPKKRKWSRQESNLLSRKTHALVENRKIHSSMHHPCSTKKPKDHRRPGRRRPMVNGAGKPEALGTQEEGDLRERKRRRAAEGDAFPRTGETDGARAPAGENPPPPNQEVAENPLRLQARKPSASLLCPILYRQSPLWLLVFLPSL